MTHKECGHNYCSLVNGEGCCACLDGRPFSKAYTRYVDGGGNIAIPNLNERYRGYCPECRAVLAGPLPLPWDKSVLPVKYNSEKRDMTRQDRLDAWRERIAKREKERMDLEKADRALLRYNQDYRRETELNSVKLADRRQTRHRIPAGPSTSHEYQAIPSLGGSSRPVYGPDSTKLSPIRGSLPSSSSAASEPHHSSSIWRNIPSIRFPNFSLPSFHHKKPEPNMPSTSTPVVEPPRYDSSDIPDSAPPPYTPFASDGTQIMATPRDEKVRG